MAYLFFNTLSADLISLSYGFIFNAFLKVDYAYFIIFNYYYAFDFLYNNFISIPIYYGLFFTILLLLYDMNYYIIFIPSFDVLILY